MRVAAALVRRAALVALSALAAVTCGEADGGSRSTSRDGADAGAPDAPPDVVVDITVPDTSPDAPPDVVDAQPRCPPVPPPDGLTTRAAERRLAVGAAHTCGIRDDGTVQCWGADIYGEGTPPGGTFIRLSVGEDHTCGIRASGEVACWGAGTALVPADDGEYGCRHLGCGQSLPPPGRFLEIAASNVFTCGIRQDLTIECWGAPAGGYTDPPCGQFVQLAAGWGNACAVDVAGAVHCWPPPWTFELRDEPAKQVALGGGCACVLYESGTLACEVGFYSQFRPFPYVTYPWTREGVQAVACGEGTIGFGSVACAILDDGTVECKRACPLNACEATCRRILDDGTVECERACPGNSCDSAQAYGGDTFTEVSCGLFACCGLRTDGTATCGTKNGQDLAPPDFPSGS